MSNPSTTNINVTQIVADNQALKMTEADITPNQAIALQEAMSLVRDLNQGMGLDEDDEYACTVRLKNAFPGSKKLHNVIDYLIAICDAHSVEWRMQILKDIWLPLWIPKRTPAPGDVWREVGLTDKEFDAHLSVVGIVLRSEYDIHAEDDEAYHEELQDLFQDYLREYPGLRA